MRNLRRYTTCIKIDNIPDHTSINSDLLASIEKQLRRCVKARDFYHQLLVNNVQAGVSNSSVEQYMINDRMEPTYLYVHKLSIGNNAIYYIGDTFHAFYQTDTCNIMYKIDNYRIKLQFGSCDFTIDYDFHANFPSAIIFPDTLAMYACYYKLFVSNVSRVDTVPLYEITLCFKFPNFEITNTNYKNLDSNAALHKYAQIKNKNGKRIYNPHNIIPRRFIRTAPSQTIIGDKLILSSELSDIQTNILDIRKETCVLNDKYRQTIHVTEQNICINSTKLPFSC